MKLDKLKPEQVRIQKGFQHDNRLDRGGAVTVGVNLSKVTILAHNDAINIDSDCLGSLYAEKGVAAADAIVCRALEEIANRLSLIERSFYRSDLTAMAKAAKSLISIATQVGLADLAQVSKDVHALAPSTDQPALAAALARLVRLGDRSLVAIWDVQDLEGTP